MIKKIVVLIFPFIIIGLLAILPGGCKKDDTDDNPQVIVLDIDSNVYHIVTIGSQVWMVENLKVSKYRNGDPIPNIADGTEWMNLTSGAYCDYENDPINSLTYGKLYNWYSVNDSRELAPAGWHIPSQEEWTQLIDYLGGGVDAGGVLKEAGTMHWESPNTGATNAKGFSALPGGTCGGLFHFYDIGKIGYWWTSTSSDATNAWTRTMYSFNTDASNYEGQKKLGFSVRCIKD
jgi:uncharacterized protein (TIGR02145 family)